MEGGHQIPSGDEGSQGKDDIDEYLGPVELRLAPIGANITDRTLVKSYANTQLALEEEQ